MTLFGIASCDTCRKARNWLDAKDLDFRFHDLRMDGIDIQMLERWSDKTEWQKLLNTRSLTWRKIPEADRANMTRERAFDTMMQHPTLVKRPVLEYGKTVVVGFSAERYAEIFADR